MYEKNIKPVIDFVTALLALVLLSPVFLFIALFLTLRNRVNPFSVQQRPGKGGKIFNIIKFKTMTGKKDQHGNLLPDYLRLTYFGKMVRKTSLDEIPQLINVLKGGITAEWIRSMKGNIETRPIWKPMHLQPVFRNSLYFGSDFAEQCFDNGLCLPSGSNLTDREFGRITDLFSEIFSFGAKN